MAQQPGSEARRAFFNEQQRATIEAAMARIIPTDDVPGAREAGTFDFVDRYLSGLDYIFARPDGRGFERLEGRRADAWKRRIDILRQRYLEGTAELDQRSHARFGSAFIDLDAGQQDTILRAMEQGSDPSASEIAEAKVTAANAPAEPALQQTDAEIDLAFFPLLALHTRQGFYADPIYGGNRDRVGWNVIGFPGPESLAEVHSGRYSVLAWFADPQGYPGTEDERGV